MKEAHPLDTLSENQRKIIFLSFISLFKKETEDLIFNTTMRLLNYTMKGVRDDIREHCEEWCMIEGSCPTECPLRKYQEENDGIH